MAGIAAQPFAPHMARSYGVRDASGEGIRPASERVRPEALAFNGRNGYEVESAAGALPFDWNERL